MSLVKYKLEILKETDIIGLKMAIVPTFPFEIKTQNGINRYWFSWNELQQQVNFLNNIFKFTRINAVQTKYDEYLKQTAKFDSNALYKNIMANNLVINNKEAFGIEHQIVLRPNKYPYDFGTNQHYLLWIHPKCSDEFKEKIFTKDGLNEIIDDLLLQHSDSLNHLQRKERLLFRNAPANKSVLAIEHFHIIFKME